MKFQAWLKLPNSTSHFTTDLLQMHHDSHSWVHWAQGKSEEDQSFTCVVFRKEWAGTVPARGQEPCGTASRGCPWGRTGPSRGTALSPTATRVCGDTPGLGPSWNVCQSESLAEHGPQPGRDGTWLGTWSPTTWMGTVPKAELKWVHFNAFHSAKSSS